MSKRYINIEKVIIVTFGLLGYMQNIFHFVSKKEGCPAFRWQPSEKTEDESLLSGKRSF